MWNNIKFIKKIKSILPLGLKLILIRLLVFLQYVFYTVFPKKIKDLDNNNRKIFVLLSTDYSNLGDHAMTYAHIKLLKDKFPESQIVEVLVGDTLKYIRYIMSSIKQQDILTLKGGGNIGLEYFREELYRRILIKKFDKNKIVLFPQTIYFPNTSTGRRELQNTVNIFRNHKQFQAFLRDQISYDLVKQDLLDRVHLIPDVALSLGNLDTTKKREGTTICLRSDKEGVYSNEQKKMVQETVGKHFNKITNTDTVTDYSITIAQRERELNKIWNTFLSSELIITDRLHGMIFAAITSTPCIVFETYNYKVTGQYSWLKHLNYIKLIKCEKDELETAINELKQLNLIPYDAKVYSGLFNKLVEVI